MNARRLDLEMVSRGLARSRAKAQHLITEKRVLVDGEDARKFSQKVTPHTRIEVDTRNKDWVGRGAYKLLAAFDHFGFEPKDAIAADIGASTGGFCEVLLTRGAQKIYAVDVGHGQLHESLKNSPRLVNLEGVNAKNITADIIPEPLDMVVSDVSFISLTKALPATLALCKDGAKLAALVKPQFEVGRKNIGKGGIVRDADLVEKVRHDMEQWINSLDGWQCLGTIESPITGSDGNREYLLGAHYNA